ncbi:MAG TPA: autotransporter-associated beta strand repeat-containing protein [Opitutaceae bacterium]|nr:autotransporter-associated beta strand repeat-containing protein [Opitutaceae bacterium]
MAIDIDPSHFGLEMYCTQPGIFDAKGNRIYANTVWPPEGLWWDGDLSREFIDGAGSGAYNPAINKFNPATGVLDRLATLYNDDTGTYVIRQAYGGRPAFMGDIIGDWREEIVVYTTDCTALRIYTTSTSAANRLYTLMQNPAYRGQTTTKGYYEAPYTDYYLGTGMPPPPPPPVTSARLVWQGGAGAANTWNTSAAAWREGVLGTSATNYLAGDAVLFDVTGAASSPVLLSGDLAPAAVTVYSPTNYTFDGTAGSLVGAMPLTKVGAGSLTLTGTHGFTGTTTIWDGAVLVDGTLSASPVVVYGGTWGGALAQGATGGRLGGSGHIAQPVTLNYRASLTPGAGMGHAGTLYLDGGLTTAGGTTLAFDLSDDPTGLAKSNDQLVVSGDLTLGGPTTLHCHLLDGALSVGTYTLATVSGTFSGAAHLAVTGLDGIPYSLSTTGGVIAMNVLATRAADSVLWQGDAGAQWDLGVTTAWSRGGAADVFVPGDAVIFDGTGSPVVDIAQAVNPASITVAADIDYTFTGGGRLTGSGGLTKTGAGKLTIETTNTFIGPVAINGGTVSIASMSDSGVPGPLGSAAASAGNLVLSGGALEFTGADAVTTDRLVTLGAGGGTFDITTAGIGFQLAGGVEGTGQLVKDGAGTLTLSTANTYSGGTVVNAGMIIMPSATANVSGLGSGPVTLNGGTLAMSNNISTYGTTAAWNITVPTGASARLELDGRSTLTGALTGGGTLELYTPYVRTELNGDWSAFTGTINAVADGDGGDIRFWNTAGLPGAELNLGTRTTTYFNAALSSNLAFPIGALSGVDGATLNSCATAGRTVTWTVGAKNVDSTFGGTIANGTGISALTKVGSGTLTLTGANTYTGATTVSAGTLLIDGTSSASAFTVQAGGVLGGTGTITGVVAFQSGSGIACGATPLQVNGTVLLNGTINVVSTGPLQSGTYPVLKATALSGSPTFVYSGPLGTEQTAAVALVGNGVYLTIGSTAPVRPSAAVTWTGAVSGFWDSVSLNWKLASDGSATYFAAGDDVVFDDSLAVQANAAVTLVSAIAPASVTFANATTAYTVTSGGGGIAGSATLTKTGVGTVTLLGGNTYTGATAVNVGTLLVEGTSSGSAFTVAAGATLGGTGTITGDVTLAGGSALRASASAPLTVNGTVTLDGALAITAPAIIPDGTYTVVAATALSGSPTWSYTAPLDNQQAASITTSGGNIVLTLSGTQPLRPLQLVQWTGAVSAVWNSSVANWRLQADGTATTFVKGDTAVFDDTSVGNRSITVPAAVEPAGVSINNTTLAYTLTGTSPGITGAAVLTKSGTGSVTMAGTNAYTGGTVIAGGTLTLSSITALGSGPVTLAGGTWATGTLTPTNTINVTADSTITGGSGGGTHGIKAVSGTGTLTLTATTGVFDLEGSLTGFTGRIALAGAGGHRLMGSAGSSAADFDLGTRTLSARSGTAIALGSLTGTSTSVLTVVSNWTTYSIGGNNKDSQFDGTITNPATTYTTSLTKAGTGTLTLTGANTYNGATNVNAGVLLIAGAQNNGAGATTVNGGTLRITGSLTNTSTVEVKSGATLELTGTLRTGTLTIRAGGKLIGGGAIVGNVVNEGLISGTGSATFAMTGNVTNAAGGMIRLVRGAGLTCSGTFANAGVLDVITAGAFPTAGGAGTVLTAASLVVADFAYAADAGAVLTLAIAYEGHTYQLQRTTDLATAGSWAGIGGAAEGTGVAMVFTDDDPPAGADRGFYRVIVDP